MSASLIRPSGFKMIDQDGPSPKGAGFFIGNCAIFTEKQQGGFSKMLNFFRNFR